MSCGVVEMLIFNFPLTLQACRNHIDLLFQTCICVFSPLFLVTNLSAFYRILRTFFCSYFPVFIMDIIPLYYFGGVVGGFGVCMLQ